MIRNKQAVEHLSDYAVVCTYNELSRFRFSAAAFSSTIRSQAVLRHCSQGLIQSLDPTEYGWTKEVDMLLPTSLPRWSGPSTPKLGNYRLQQSIR